MGSLCQLILCILWSLLDVGRNALTLRIFYCLLLSLPSTACFIMFSKELDVYFEKLQIAFILVFSLVKRQDFFFSSTLLVF